MIRHLLLFGLLVRCLPICAQDFGWAIRQSGSDAEAVYQVAEDAAGNIYEAGNFLEHR
ncbi:MAG: hypothetical protein IPO83_05375 [Chitinophagaceae bacterium]|nr:hypothetical protein [Chitinophagaceae bacterium]